MSSFAKRLASLEGNMFAVSLNGLTDEQLNALIGTLAPGSPQLLSAVLTKVLRQGSAWPIVVTDLEHTTANEHEADDGGY